MFDFTEFLKGQVEKFGLMSIEVRFANEIKAVREEFDKSSSRYAACIMLGALLERHKNKTEQEIIFKAFYSSGWASITEEQVHKVMSAKVKAGLLSRPAQDIYRACDNVYEYHIMAGRLIERFSGSTQEAKIMKALGTVASV